MKTETNTPLTLIRRSLKNKASFQVFGEIIRCVFEKKCEHKSIDICFSLKAEKYEQRGKTAPFIGVKKDQNENGVM